MKQFNNRKFCGFTQHHLFGVRKGREYLSSNAFYKGTSGAGFTLIELLVVISIVGLLLSAILVIINPAEQLQKTRDTQRKRHLGQIQTALDAYYTDNNRYPDADISAQIYGAPWNSEWYPYMAKVPKDPLGLEQGHKNYYYQVAEDKTWYRLYAKLERCPDPQTIPQTQANCATELYNYGVASSNLIATAFSGPTPALIPTSTPAPPTPTPGPATPTPTPPAPTATPTPTPTIIPNLIGKWSFNDSEAPGKDSSGNNNHGTLLPVASASASGPTWKGPSTCGSGVGGCLQFDGVDDSVSLPNIAALNLTTNFTIDARVKMASFCTGAGCNGGVIYSNRASCPGGGINFSVSGPQGNLQLVAIGGNEVHYNQSIALDTWVRLSTTRSGTDVNLYINGNTTPVASGTIASIGSGGSPYIGREPGCLGFFFKGLMDEVQIYDRALSPAEISSL